MVSVRILRPVCLKNPAYFFLGGGPASPALDHWNDRVLPESPNQDEKKKDWGQRKHDQRANYAYRSTSDLHQNRGYARRVRHCLPFSYSGHRGAGGSDAAMLSAAALCALRAIRAGRLARVAASQQLPPPPIHGQGQTQRLRLLLLRAPAVIGLHTSEHTLPDSPR
jgi:hypothetical protein